MTMLAENHIVAPEANPAAVWSKRSLDGVGEEQVVTMAETLAHSLNIDPLAARLLILRGYQDEADAADYLGAGLSALPDPFLMKGMTEATDRLLKVVLRREKVLLSVDYDCDGNMSGAVLASFFKALDVPYRLFVPNRETHGYGLDADTIRQAAKDGYKVMVTADCGISALEEARVAAHLGVDCIITDHHQVGDELPFALAVINPHQPECEYPDKNLCGAGVAFMLLVALRKRLRDAGYFNSHRQEPDLKQYLDLVAVATVADMVPLIGVNRILVRHGLKLIEEETRTGLAQLVEVAGLKRVSAGSIGFNIGPRINAAGRLEDSSIGVNLMLETDPAKAKALAEQLDTLNKERQLIEQDIVEWACGEVDAGRAGDRILILAAEHIHPGVMGIAASKLVERYHRPAILISLDGEKGKGSARSIKGLHLFKALQSCEKHLVAYGGHEFAAGLTVDRESLPGFMDAMEALALDLLSVEDLVPVKTYDLELQLADVTLDLVNTIARLEPFGMKNATPVFFANNLSASSIRILKERHLAFSLKQHNASTNGIAFGQVDAKEMLEKGPVDILFQATINEFRGNKSLQLDIKDIRRTDRKNRLPF